MCMLEWFRSPIFVARKPGNLDAIPFERHAREKVRARQAFANEIQLLSINEERGVNGRILLEPIDPSLRDRGWSEKMIHTGEEIWRVIG